MNTPRPAESVSESAVSILLLPLHGTVNGHNSEENVRKETVSVSR